MCTPVYVCVFVCFPACESPPLHLRRFVSMRTSRTRGSSSASWCVSPLLSFSLTPVPPPHAFRASFSPLPTASLLRAFCLPYSLCSGVFYISLHTPWRIVLTHTHAPPQEEYLGEFNSMTKKPMDLVMFMFFIQHVSRIIRVLKMPGAGASGFVVCLRLCCPVLCGCSCCLCCFAAPVPFGTC